MAITDSLPALARLGYRYEEAIDLPGWLFWVLLGAEQKDQVVGQSRLREAVGVASGNFSEEYTKEIFSNWNKVLRDGIPEADEQSQQASQEEIDRAWDRLGALVSGG